MKFTAALLKRIGPVSKRFSNFPDSYIERSMEQVYWKTPRGKPQYLPRTVERKKFYFSVHRPWTHEFHRDNSINTVHQFVHLEPIKNWSFFRGDRVEVLVGKDKGKQGFVKDIIQERNWVIVEGLNTKLMVMGKRTDFPGIYKQEEQPLLVTNQVQLVDPFDLAATTIEWRYTEDGSHVRISTRTGRIIPIPVSNNETVDYKVPHLYKEQPKDTTAADVEEVTFTAELKTFEMDIMDRMGIKEDRVPKKYYWY